MKAICWHGTTDVRLDTVPEPKILDTRDAVIKVTSTAICGSDIHCMTGTFLPWKAATYWAMSSWAMWLPWVRT